MRQVNFFNQVRSVNIKVRTDRRKHNSGGEEQEAKFAPTSCWPPPTPPPPTIIPCQHPAAQDTWFLLLPLHKAIPCRDPCLVKDFHPPHVCVLRFPVGRPSPSFSVSSHSSSPGQDGFLPSNSPSYLSKCKIWYGKPVAPGNWQNSPFNVIKPQGTSERYNRFSSLFRSLTCAGQQPRTIF